MTDTALTTRTPAQQVCEAALKIDKQKKPSHADRAAFRALVDSEPDLWRCCGDMARGAQDQLLAAFTIPPATRESLSIGLGRMRRELAGDDAPRMLALLAEHAVTCWLRLHVVEYAYTSNIYEAKDGYTFAKGDYWERRLSMAQHRYLRALETLARVKRLAIPVQVNVALDGGQQVNMAGR